jgi:hypothetical protein
MASTKSYIKIRMIYIDDVMWYSLCGKYVDHVFEKYYELKWKVVIPLSPIVAMQHRS